MVSAMQTDWYKTMTALAIVLQRGLLQFIAIVKCEIS